MMYCYTCNGNCRGELYHKQLNNEIEQMNETWLLGEGEE